MIPGSASDGWAGRQGWPSWRLGAQKDPGRVPDTQEQDQGSPVPEPAPKSRQEALHEPSLGAFSDGSFLEWP